MSDAPRGNSLRDRLHAATHRIPGVPEHVDHPAGRHHGSALQDETVHRGRRQGGPLQDRQTGRLDVAPPRDQAVPHRHTLNHSAARPARVLASWQRRIGALFGHEV